MPRKTHVLFTLDEDEKFRLACDDLQWILERGSPRRARPGRASGYTGKHFVSHTKSVLERCIREMGIPLTPKAKALLEVLPGTFPECRARIEAAGIDDFRHWLSDTVDTEKGDARRSLAV